MIYRLLADSVLVVHLLFIVFVVVGSAIALRFPWVALAHVPAALWGAYIELSGGLCPLTPLENGFRHAAGDSGFTGDFIDHYLVPIIYPAGLTTNIQFWIAGFVIVLNISIYAWFIYRLWARREQGAAGKPAE
jgi:hypothetical protein